MDWKALWSKFRGTHYFRITYLALTSALCALVLAATFRTAVVCFSVLLIPVLTLLIPHWFGERRAKHHALNGVLVLVLTTLFFAALFTPSYASQGEYVLDATGDDVTLSNGIVRPFRANLGAADFNFTVTMRVANATDPANFTLRVQVLSLVGLDVGNQTVDMAPDLRGLDELSDGAFWNGERFYAVVRLEPYAHSYSFQVTNESSNTFAVRTVGVPGPYNAPYGTYFALWLINGFFQMILIVIGFYLLLMIYWWTRKAREMRGARPDKGRKRDEGGGEYTCTNCGGDVSDADTKCPNCGADFGPGTERLEPAEAKPKA